MKALIRITRKLLSHAMKAHLASLRLAVQQADDGLASAAFNEDMAERTLRMAQDATDTAHRHKIAVRNAANAEAATFNERI